MNVSRSRLRLRARIREDLGRQAVVERQDVELLRLLEPRGDQRLEPLGLLCGEVVRLGAVLLGVEELPDVVVEVAETRCRAVHGHRLPAVLPDAARAEHRVVLALLRRRRIALVERVLHRHARERHLLVPVQRVREVEADALEDRRDDVDRVVVLVAHLALGADPAGQWTTIGSLMPPW